MAIFDLVLKEASAITLGELLRELSFSGEGYGCYEVFEPRKDAEKWSDDQKYAFWDTVENLCGKFRPDDDQLTFWTKMGEGWSWIEGTYTIECCYYWDGDGTLAFIVKEDGKAKRCICNDDCKKTSTWYNIHIKEP